MCKFTARKFLLPLHSLTHRMLHTNILTYIQIHIHSQNRSNIHKLKHALTFKNTDACTHTLLTHSLFHKNMLNHVFNQMTIPTNSLKLKYKYIQSDAPTHTFTYTYYLQSSNPDCAHMNAWIQACSHPSWSWNICWRKCTHTSFHVHPYFILRCSLYIN